MRYISTVGKINSDLRPRQIRTMALDFAIKEKISYPRTWNNAGMAGIDWYYRFMKRNHNFSNTQQELYIKPDPDAVSYSQTTNPLNDILFVRAVKIEPENEYEVDDPWNQLDPFGDIDEGTENNGNLTQKFTSKENKAMMKRTAGNREEGEPPAKRERSSNKEPAVQNANLVKVKQERTSVDLNDQYM